MADINLKMKKAREELYKYIHEMEAKVEKMEDEYEEAIKNGNFELKCPYPEIIKIYDDIMEAVVKSHAWGFDSDCYYQYEEANYCFIQQEYEKKLEEDKKIREKRK